jgi:hypothetical protein
LLWLSVKDVEWANVREGFREANYLWVFLGLAIAVWSHWLRAARWVLLFRAAGYEANTLNLFASVMVGNMVNQALPRAGEISRATVTARSERIPLSVTFGTMVTDRIFDVIILGLLIGTVFLLQFKEIMAIIDKAFSDNSAAAQPVANSGMPVWQVATLVAMGVVALATAVFWRRISRTKLFQRGLAFGRETLKTVLSVRRMDRPILFIVYSVGIWACYVMMTYLVFFSLDPTAGLDPMFALTAFTMGGIGMVLPTPGGIGTYHFAIIMSFVAYAPSFGWTEQYAKTVGTNLAFIIHTSQMIMMIAVGLLCYFYLLQKIRLNKQEGEPQP